MFVNAVVASKETNKTSAVPTSWLTKNQTGMWPNYRTPARITKAVRSSETPTDESFRLYREKVLQNYSTYELAKRQAKKAEVTSELSSEESTPPRPRRAKHAATVHIKEECDRSYSENEGECAPCLPKFPRPESVSSDNYHNQNPINQSPYEESQMGGNEQAQVNSTPPDHYMPPSTAYLPSFQSIPFSADINHSSAFNPHQNFQNIWSYSTAGPTGFDPLRNLADVRNLTHRELPSGFSVIGLQGLAPSDRMSHVNAYNEHGYFGSYQGMNTNVGSPFQDDSTSTPNVVGKDLPTMNRNQSSAENLTVSENHRNEKSVASGSQSDFQNWVVRNVTIVKTQMKQIQETLGVVLTNRSPPTVVKEFINIATFCKLPVNDISHLEEMETALLDAKKRESMIHHLSLHGGKDVGDSTRRILSALMRDEVAERFSWLGSRGEKLSFANSFLKSLLYDSVRQNCTTSNATDSQLEIAIKEWLKYAKKRLGFRKWAASRP